jgi:hypothetical protein
MATPELIAAAVSRSAAGDLNPLARRRGLIDLAAVCSLGMVVVTGVGFVLAGVAPALAPSVRPHPTLRPTAAPIATIMLHNARVLAAPYILIAARFARSWRTRVAGDVILTAILAGNALWIGIALGRWRGALIPYLPQLPLEYGAAGTAAGAWVDRRRRVSDGGSPDGRRLAISGLVTTTLLAVAAAVEVLLTPHAP